MIRRVLALFLLILVAAAIWLGARWFRSRNDLRATVVVSSADSLREGDPVMEDKNVIGQVRDITSLEGRDAVLIHVPERHRQRVMTDSIFYVLEKDGRGSLQVTNTLAIGTPLEDGAVVKARDDRLARLLVKHGPQIEAFLGTVRDRTATLLRDYDSGELSRELEDLKARVPEWEKQGAEVLSERIGDLKKRARKVEDALRKENRDEEANRLRERVDKWLGDIKAREKDQ